MVSYNNSVYNDPVYNDPVTENMLCAGIETIETEKIGFCEGDTGGPIIVQEGNTWKLAGISSWQGLNAECGQKGLYDVFTRISKFKNFIVQYLPLIPGDINGEFYGSVYIY